MKEGASNQKKPFHEITGGGFRGSCAFLILTHKADVGSRRVAVGRPPRDIRNGQVPYVPSFAFMTQSASAWGRWSMEGAEDSMSAKVRYQIHRGYQRYSCRSIIIRHHNMACHCSLQYWNSELLTLKEIQMASLPRRRNE